MDVPASVIEACKRGDPDGFEELIRLTHRDVFTLALRLVGNPDDAAEVSQETYIKLLRAIKSFRGEAKFSTWLYRVTSNAAITLLRKRARHRLDVPFESEAWRDFPASPATDPEAVSENTRLKERLDDALSALPAGYRTVVVMKDVYGFSLNEIGKQLGISEGAAKVRLFRARQRLKDILYEDGTIEYRSERKEIDGMP